MKTFVLIAVFLLVGLQEGTAAVNKIGGCPQLIDILMPPPPCVHPCSSDGDCEGDKKCCFSDCNGNTCMDPYPVNKIGRCPQLIDILMPPFELPPCVNPCSSDGDCKGDEKCCFSDCNDNVCMDPYPETDNHHCNLGCLMVYSPVCGSDRVTYSNECVLTSTACVRNQRFIKVAYEGECK